MKGKFEKIRLPLLVTITAVLLAGLAAGAWFIRPQQVMERARESLDGSPSVEVKEIELSGVKGFFVRPVSGGGKTNVIFYPGARVPPKAYVPVALDIAREGYGVFLLRMPLNLAVFGWKKARKIINSRDDYRRWVLAGHSMGGAMAARFISSTDYPVQGLVLWASYPPEKAKFPSSLSVLSITGERDEVISRDKLERSRNQLPGSAEFVEIEGANHSQFGWYGFQAGDGKASISRDRQTELVARLTVDFLDSL